MREKPKERWPSQCVLSSVKCSSIEKPELRDRGYRPCLKGKKSSGRRCRNRTVPDPGRAEPGCSGRIPQPDGLIRSETCARNNACPTRSPGRKSKSHRELRNEENLVWRASRDF